MVLPTGLLQVVSSELEWVQFELNTSVVDHILSDRHCRGGAKGPERSVAWSVGLANLAVDAEAGELVDDDGDGDDDDKYDGGANTSLNLQSDDGKLGTTFETGGK